MTKSIVLPGISWRSVPPMMEFFSISDHTHHIQLCENLPVVSAAPHELSGKWEALGFFLWTGPSWLTVWWHINWRWMYWSPDDVRAGLFHADRLMCKSPVRFLRSIATFRLQVIERKYDGENMMSSSLNMNVENHKKMSLIHNDNNCLHITYVGKQCLFLVFWLQGEVNVPVFEMCAEGCWHRESAWTCISGQHMNLSWRKTEWLPSSWLRNAEQGSPDFRVSLLPVLFQKRVAFISKVWPEEGN